MSILFIVGYQVVPRLLQRFEGFTLEPYARYLLPLPPAWFAGIDSWVAGDRPVTGLLPLALGGLLATAALAYIGIGKLAPSYGEGLTRLSESKSRAPKPARLRKRSDIDSQSDPALVVARIRSSRWSFRLAAVYMRPRSRHQASSLSLAKYFSGLSVNRLLDRKPGGFSVFVPL